MCGILGVKGNVSKQQFHQALNQLSHRGPDCSDIYVNDDILLGHTRLAIIDLLPEANQPFYYKDYVIVFNGEIYNYKELSKKYFLDLSTTSDTEVLLKLYEKMGVECFNELNGMFSLCIYDQNNQTLILARDRFGKKPLYYLFNEEIFVFASEMKAITTLLNVNPKVNQQSFEEYLSYLSPVGNHTFLTDIVKLEAGTYATFNIKQQELTLSRYYELHSCVKELPITEDRALQEIENLIFDSLRLRLVSDVPIASFLSGGIDSTLISTLYASLSEKKIDTFSIGYEEYKQYDELYYAKLASQAIQSNHHEMIVSKKDFVDAFEEIITLLDEPINDSAIIPTYMLSKEVQKHGYKVVLSGEGSDEIFMGYDAYFDYLRFNHIDNELSIDSKKIMEDYHKQNPNLSKNYEILRRIYEHEQPFYHLIAECYTPLQKSFLLKNEFQDTSYYFQELFQKSQRKRIDYWMSYADIKHWISEVLMTKMDRMTMAHSLEARAPFLDYRLVEYVLSLSADLRMGKTTKNLLKKIALKYIPSEIVNRQKKGFSSPYVEWYYDVYQSKTIEDLQKINKELNWFNEDFLAYLYEQGKEGKFKQHMWALIVFSRWFMKKYM